MNNHIFFSIIICCYNSENFLKETLQSIFEQEYKNWEIVIINDGSIDNTEEIVFKYISLGYPITYFFQKNKGFAAARNKAVELSKGRWIMIVDHDDICQKQRLKIQHENIQNNPDKKLFFGNCIFFDNINQPYTRFDLLEKTDGVKIYDLNFNKVISTNNLIKYGCFISSSSVVFCKEVYKKIKGFNEKYKSIADYDFFYRLSLIENIFCSKEILCSWRIHENQSSEKNKNMTNLELCKFYTRVYYNNRIKLNIKIKLFFRHLSLLYLMAKYYIFFYYK